MLRRRQGYEHKQWPLTCPAAAFHWASLTVCKWIITKAKRLEWKWGEHLMNHVFTYFYIRNVIWHTYSRMIIRQFGFCHLMNFHLSFVRIFNQNNNNLKRYQLFIICVHLGTGRISVSLSSCFFFSPLPSKLSVFPGTLKEHCGILFFPVSPDHTCFTCSHLRLLLHIAM